MPGRLSVLLVVVAAALTAQAQVWIGRTEVGLTAGGMNYIGDLNGQTMTDKVNLAYGAFARYNFNERVSLRFDVDYGHVEGGNPDRIVRRNLSFRSHIIEGALRVEFNYFPFSQREDHFRWTPFLFGGFGFFGFNPQAWYEEKNAWYDLRPLSTEGQGTALNPDVMPYNTMQLNFPFGLGVKYCPSKSITLAAEYGFRKTWTDYLDDVSTTYVDNSELARIKGSEAAALADRSGEVEVGYVNAAGIKRGDDSLDDWYAYFNISVSIKLDLIFGSMLKKKCDIR